MTDERDGERAAVGIQGRFYRLTQQTEYHSCVTSLSLSLSLTSLVALSVAVELVEKSVKPLLQDKKKKNNIHNFNPESPGLSMPASSSYNQCVFQSYILTVIQTRADSVGKEVLDPTRSQVFHMTPMGEPEKLRGKYKAITMQG